MYCPRRKHSGSHQLHGTIRFGIFGQFSTNHRKHTIREDVQVLSIRPHAKTLLVVWAMMASSTESDVNVKRVEGAQKDRFRIQNAGTYVIQNASLNTNMSCSQVGQIFVANKKIPIHRIERTASEVVLSFTSYRHSAQ